LARVVLWIPADVTTEPQETRSMARITTIEGIGPAFAAKLEAAGITTTGALLERGADPAGRRDIAEQTGIGGKQILRWVNMVDLCRIGGVGPEYAELLEAAGVDTVPELARRNPINLYVAMTAANEDRNLVRRPPTASAVVAWVAEAKELPRVIAY
jgi:predicted flap endonuclease-1-like 5' DNA nuclease